MRRFLYDTSGGVASGHFPLILSGARLQIAGGWQDRFGKSDEPRDDPRATRVTTAFSRLCHVGRGEGGGEDDSAAATAVTRLPR